MILLTTPIQSPTLRGVAVTNNIIVPNISNFPNNFIITQKIPLINNVSYKWYFSILDDVANKIASGEISGFIKSNFQLKYSIYSISGDNILYKVTPIIDSGDVAIKITNNDVNDFVVNLTRTLL